MSITGIAARPDAPFLAIGGIQIARNAPGFMAALASAYPNQCRPRCLCRPGGVEMYIARHTDGFVVKRMPETGTQHAPHCPSFEAPAGATGRSALLGTAIRENPITGVTALRLGVPMSQLGHRRTTAQVRERSQVASSQGARLSLQGLMHYLWDEAGLTRWHPGFRGKRSWALVRSRLLKAAESTTANGHPLLSRLYVPEMFSVDQWPTIVERRSRLWARAQSGGTRSFPLLLLMAEVKAFMPADGAGRLVIKHMPDLAFLLDEPLMKTTLKRFGADLEFWTAVSGLRLVISATFSINRTGVPCISALSLMPTNQDWIPVEQAQELQLIQSLQSEARAFIKCLRYEKPLVERIASAVLTDCPDVAELLYADISRELSAS